MGQCRAVIRTCGTVPDSNKGCGTVPDSTAEQGMYSMGTMTNYNFERCDYVTLWEIPEIADVESSNFESLTY